MNEKKREKRANNLSDYFLGIEWHRIKIILSIKLKRSQQLNIKALIMATTQERELVVDPCAGSFIVLELCQELKRNFCGVDLTYEEMGEFMREKN